MDFILPILYLVHIFSMSCYSGFKNVHIYKYCYIYFARINKDLVWIKSGSRPTQNLNKLDLVIKKVHQVLEWILKWLGSVLALSQLSNRTIIIPVHKNGKTFLFNFWKLGEWTRWHPIKFATSLAKFSFGKNKWDSLDSLSYSHIVW